MAAEQYTLPPLPFAYNALEPHISAQIMELHHSKHHAAYVANLNKALAVAPQTANTRSLIHFNGGGHINHSIFWKNLAPASTQDSNTSSAPTLIAEVEKEFGSFNDFKSKFNAALLGIQGSGWGWLVIKNQTGKLEIVTSKDQDTVPAGTTAIFGVDMWEHAYYLQYLNGKAAYVENIWNVINWTFAESRFKGHEAAEGEFKELRALL